MIQDASNWTKFFTNFPIALLYSLPVQASSDPCQSGRLGISPAQRHVSFWVSGWGRRGIDSLQGRGKSYIVKESGLRCDTVQYLPTVCIQCAPNSCAIVFMLLAFNCFSLGHGLLPGISIDTLPFLPEIFPPGRTNFTSYAVRST